MKTLLSIILLTIASVSYAQDNVVIVLDASGSMNDNMGKVSKMDVAKVAISEAIATIPDSTNIGIIVFSNYVKEPWIYPLAPKDSRKIIPAINSINEGGSTPLAEYMKAGADTLLNARKMNHGYGEYRLLVVTDGEANDIPLMIKWSNDITRKGIRLDVIGIGMDKDHSLSKVAHSYKKGNDLDSLRKAMVEGLAEISNGADSNIDFSILDGLPDLLITGVIDKLNEQNDSFIGEKPAKKVVEKPVEKVESETTTTNFGNKLVMQNPEKSKPPIGLITFAGIVIFGIIGTVMASISKSLKRN